MTEQPLVVVPLPLGPANAITQALSTAAPRLFFKPNPIGQGGASGILRLALGGASQLSPSNARTQASVTAVMVGGMAFDRAWIDLGNWPAGSYQIRTKSRSDVSGAPQALAVTVTMGGPGPPDGTGTVVGTGTLYSSGDTVSMTYPTAWTDYDGLVGFTLPVRADVVVRWGNPTGLHLPGQHIWIGGLQLHRVS